MNYLGQRIQVDVKFVPTICLVNEAKSLHFYQYTAIDAFSSWRFVETFEKHTTCSSALFCEPPRQDISLPNRMYSVGFPTLFI